MKIEEDVIQKIRFGRAKQFESQESFTASFSKVNLSNGKLNKCEKEEIVPSGDKAGGIPLYSDGVYSYLDPSDSHSVIIGSTGSKKTRLVAMPAILALGIAGESMIVADPKGELYKATYSFLETKKYKTFTIDFRSPQLSNGWNPLAQAYTYYINGKIDECSASLSDLSMNFIGMEKGIVDPFWDNAAGSLFRGLSLLLFKICNLAYPDDSIKASLENINWLRMKMFEMGNQISFARALKAERIDLLGDKELLWCFAYSDDEIKRLISVANSSAQETNAGVLGVFDSKMQFLQSNSSVNAMLSRTEFEIEDFSERPSAIFLIYPDEKSTYDNLVSLFIKQSYEKLIHKAGNESLRVRVNYVLDEFSSLPPIKDFPAMITAARSRGIRYNLFIQSKHQLQLRYEQEADTIMSNCDNWIYLYNRDLDFLQELSALCGEYTDRSGNRKPVISVTELQRLNKHRGDALVLHKRCKPYLSTLSDISCYSFLEESVNNCPSKDRVDIFNTSSGLDLEFLRRHYKKL